MLATNGRAILICFIHRPTTTTTSTICYSRHLHSSKNRTICSDALKYELMNNAKSSLDEKTHIRRRQLAYKNIYNLYKLNQKSNIKIDHLYIFMYSKYFTQRYILREKRIDSSFVDDDDEEIKSQFHKILQNQTIASPAELEEKYLEVVKDLKKDEIVFSEYKALNIRINENSMEQDEKDLFYFGTSDTDIYMQRKLQLDIEKFLPRKEKFIRFLNNYQFVNGWITSGAIASLTIAYSFFAK